MNAVYSRLANLQMSGGISLDNIRNETSNLRSRFSNLRGPRDFFDFKRVSRPLGWGDAQSRVTFNLRYFSSDYSLIILSLVVYALLTNLLLLFVLILAVGGFLGISALGGADLVLPGGLVITSQSLYIALGVVTVPLFIIASPMATMFWLIGAAAVTILGHASLLEKPLESEFAEQV